MSDKGIYEDFSQVKRRAGGVYAMIGILCAVALVWYWKIQILDFKKFDALSVANRTRETELAAARGILTDRTGAVILADNRASFKASFIRENTRGENASIQRAAALLGLEPAVVAARIDKYRSWPVYRPIVVKDNLTFDEVARIEAWKNEMPELIIETEPKRIYPFGKMAAHVLGYLQEADADDLKTHSGRLRPGDVIGKMGIEGWYDERITGRNGKLVEIVDSLGRKQGEVERIEPEAGPRLALSLDCDLQAEAEALLVGKEGSVVVLDPASGEVLAMASNPTFDPNKFITRFTPEEWQTLVENPDNPLLNRATQGLYSPGSLFKPVMGIIGLATGAVTTESTVYCPGAVEIYGAIRHCWNEAGHGALALRDAIRYSCNIYFYTLGRRISIDTIAGYARRVGLGRKTGIDISGEREGLVPDTEWKKTTRDKVWYPGETISVAIGQGQLQATPLQMAVLAARLANRGRGVRPHLMRDAPGEPGEEEPLDIPASTFEQVIEGMWRSVNMGGTGAAARVEHFDVCGKTGSTQTISRDTAERLAGGARIKKTHSWFMGFAPRRQPRIAMAILVEYGGGGGATAAPIAGRLFALFKEKNDRSRAASGN